MKNNYSFMKASAHVSTFSDVMVKVLAERHPDITFIHVYPGMVDTPLMRVNWWMSMLMNVSKPFLCKPRDAAQFLLYPFLNSEFGGGAYYLDENANQLKLNDTFTDDFTSRVWEHSLQRAQVRE